MTQGQSMIVFSKTPISKVLFVICYTVEEQYLLLFYSIVLKID